MKNIAFSITFIALSGCSSAPQEIKNQDLSYENIKYENKSVSTAEAPAKFQAHISSCKFDAQRQLETDIKNAELLTSIYGQPIKIDDLKLKSKLHVVMCMAGDKRSGATGKGWSIVKDS